ILLFPLHSPLFFLVLAVRPYSFVKICPHFTTIFVKHKNSRGLMRFLGVVFVHLSAFRKT
ncbi:MAG: hypothetical protein J7L96_07410, partial [Bacteroidales bacterium]|nr:hypothetical protein [Bacteroidales bacterium]